MSGANPNIVHEAEAQRQHIRIPLPVRVMIAGQTYMASDWSNGGVGLQVAEGTSFPMALALGSKCDAVIHFPFEGFGMTLPVQLRITHAGRDSGKVGCAFENLNRQQQSVIQYFVTAYVSGEIIRVQDMLDVVSRNNFTTARTLPDPDAGLTAAQISRRRMEYRLRMGALLCLAAILAFYSTISLYERLFIIKASTARVTSEMLTVDAPAGGKVYFQPVAPDALIEKGRPLLNVATGAGNILSIDSPCDCIIKQRLTENNRLVRKGEPLLELVSRSATPYIEAALPPAQAVKLAKGQEALIALPGSKDHLRGKVVAIHAGRGLQENSLVIIEAKKALPVETVNDPVEVRFDTLNWL